VGFFFAKKYFLWSKGKSSLHTKPLRARRFLRNKGTKKNLSDCPSDKVIRAGRQISFFLTFFAEKSLSVSSRSRWLPVRKKFAKQKREHSFSYLSIPVSKGKKRIHCFVPCAVYIASRQTFIQLFYFSNRILPAHLKE